MRGLLRKAPCLQHRNNKACDKNKLNIKRNNYMAKDPICGMQVDEKTAEYSIVRKGIKYYFCSENCYKEFKSK